LVEWYETEYALSQSEKVQTASLPARNAKAKADPLLQLRGLGKELWKDEKADEYVRRLRQGWS
jgi:hypothetical protein